MAKYGFYGVYGRNGGGVYTNWSDFEKSKPYIPSVKVKKFSSRKETVHYIVDGLAHVYHVCEEDEIKLDALYSHTNWYLAEGELIDYRMG